jgi:quercetin dioxygenase-like cupin family protein
MQPILISLEPGGVCGEHPYTSAEGEEFAMLIAGTAEFEQQDKRYQLSQGDAVYYDPRQLHNWRNLGQDMAVLLIVVAQ